MDGRLGPEYARHDPRLSLPDLGVLRWLDLQPDDILLCERDEDLDRFLLGGGSVSEQVKAYTGGLGLSDRAVLRSWNRSATSSAFQPAEW